MPSVVKDERFWIGLVVGFLLPWLIGYARAFMAQRGAR